MCFTPSGDMPAGGRLRRLWLSERGSAGREAWRRRRGESVDKGVWAGSGVMKSVQGQRGDGPRREVRLFCVGSGIGVSASCGRTSVQAGGNGKEQMRQGRYALFEDHGRLTVGTGGHVGIVLGCRLRQRLTEPQGHGGLKESEDGPLGAVMQPEVADLAEARGQHMLEEAADELRAVPAAWCAAGWCRSCDSAP